MLKKAAQQCNAASAVFKFSASAKQQAAKAFIVQQQQQQRNYARQSRGSFVLSEYANITNSHTPFPVAAVFGCTGFVGRAIVQELTTAGYQVITAYRGSDFKVQDHKVMGDVGQVVGMRYATDKYETILDICARANVVVNTVGRFYPKWWDDDWQFSNVEVPRMIAKASTETNVSRFIQVSHLGAHVEHPSQYLRVKALAENAVKAEFPSATILRPADAFGERDKLLMHIGRRLQANRLLGVPVVDRGVAKLQPVFVSNIGDAVISTLAQKNSVGETYELGGPKIYKYHELIKFVADYIGARYTVTPLHILPATLMGLANEYRTNKATFSRDWAVRYSYDNLVSPNAKTFADLGIEPVSLEEAAFPLLRKFMRWQYHNIKDNYNYVK